MTDDEVLALTRDRMLAALDIYFPVKSEAPRAATPEASVTPLPAKETERGTQ